MSVVWWESDGENTHHEIIKSLEMTTFGDKRLAFFT